MFQILRRSAWAPQYLSRIHTAGYIVGGPFKGMAYDGNAVGSASIPKLLGVYEIELSDTLDQWTKIPFRTIIDVGAAEGYYAVGSALRWPKASVFAFETTDEGRRLILRNAELNDVRGRMTIQGHCELKELQTAMAGPYPTLLIMDVEGAERTLLDTSQIPELHSAHIIVEVHDCFDPEVGEIVLGHLRETHSIKEIWTTQRTPRDFAKPESWILKQWLWPYLLQYASELRPGPMRWFCCEPLHPDARSAG